MYELKIRSLRWLDSLDETENLCLHGNVTAINGDEQLEYDDATVSSTALYLLKSIEEDHIIWHENQMLPCCGFYIIPNETKDTVAICGCPNGIDWSVIHENGQIKLITEDDKFTFVSTEEYKQVAFQFADEVENFYNNSKKKIFSDEESRDGYEAFWNEWHRRRMKTY